MKSAHRAEVDSAQRGSSTIAAFFAAIITLLAATFGLQHAPVATASQPAAAAQSATQQFQDLSSQARPSPASSSQASLSHASSSDQQQQSTAPTEPAQHISIASQQQQSSPAQTITAVAGQGSAVTSELAQLSSLGDQLQSDIASLPTDDPATSSYLTVPAWAPSQAIDQLSGTTLNDVTVNGISGLAAADIPAIDLTNGVSGILPSASGGTGTTSLPAAMDSLTGASGTLTGAVVRLQSGAYGLAASVCSLFSDATTCAKLLGYADPRQFGATCGSEFDTNNSSDDDAPGINAALETGVPVMIPYPGCKIASQVKFTGNGETLFSFGSAGPYDAQLTPTEPYLFVTNDVASSSPNNCAIDTKGYDGITLRDITMLANYSKEGTVAICNSVGIQSGLTAAFLNIDGVTISGFGDGIGGAVTSTFTPTGTLQNNVFQIRGQNLNVSNSGMGMYGNFSDVHLSDTFFSSNDGPCFSTIPGYSGAIDMDNMRCEYSGGPYGGSTLQEDGTGIYLDGSNAVQLSNVICDHDYGACITIGDGTGAGSHVTLDNVTSYDSDKGGTNVTNQCHYVINGASYISATNIEAINRSYNAPYTLCTLGHPDYITWHAVTGVAGGAAGYATSYLNMQYPITHFDFSALGLSSFVLGDNTGIDTSSPSYPLDVGGYINTDQFSGYKQAGITVLYSTSTLESLLLGPWAGNSTFTGSNNIAIGSSTLAALTTGSNDTAISALALSSLMTGSSNVALGDSALEFATSTSDNTAIGHKALIMSTSGYNSGNYNTAVGAYSLDYISSGSNNTGIGASALEFDTSGSTNVAIGVNALYANRSPTSTVAIGVSAACGTSCGVSANYNNQGGVYVGYYSGENASTGSDFNTFVGYQAGRDVTAGNDNILIGPEVNTGGNHLTTGQGNIGIGYNVVFPGGTSASNQLNIANVIFGTGLTATSSGTSIPSVLTGNIGIGTSKPYSTLQVTGPDTASTSAFAVVNSASTTVFAAYDNGNATYAGSIFQSSDQRLKTDITSLDASSSLSEIEQLNPVSYLRLDEPFSGQNLGFLAQQVEAIFPQLVSTTSPTALTPDGTLTLNYTGLIAPIVGAIQDVALISGDFETNLIAWLGNASNGIGDLFAQNIYASNVTADQVTANQELCVGSTCIDQQQLGFVDKRGFPNRPTSDSRLHLGRRCSFGRADRGDERRLGDHRVFVAGGAGSLGSAGAG